MLVDVSLTKKQPETSQRNAQFMSAAATGNVEKKENPPTNLRN